MSKQICKPNSVPRYARDKFLQFKIKNERVYPERSEWAIICLGFALLRSSSGLLFSMEFKLDGLHRFDLAPDKDLAVSFPMSPLDLSRKLRDTRILSSSGVTVRTSANFVQIFDLVTKLSIPRSGINSATMNWKNWPTAVSRYLF